MIIQPGFHRVRVLLLPRPPDAGAGRVHGLRRAPLRLAGADFHPARVSCSLEARDRDRDPPLSLLQSRRLSAKGLARSGLQPRLAPPTPPGLLAPGSRVPGVAVRVALQRQPRLVSGGVQFSKSSEAASGAIEELNANQVGTARRKSGGRWGALCVEPP